MTHIKVEDDKDLVRDSSSGAILNTNRKALEDYKRSRNYKLQMQDKVEVLEDRIKQLENLINIIIEKNN